jgi:hypothetical protein
MKHPLLFAAIATVTALLMPQEALASAEIDAASPEEADAVSFDGEAILDDAAIVSDAELADQRGGFTLAGMEIRLGAEMRTYLNGDLALMTVVNWGPDGVTSSQTASAALSAARLDALQAGLAGSGSFALKMGDTPVYLANNGQTALLQRADSAIQNVLINTASNISVTQQTEATLDLSGYQGFQTDILSSRLSDALGSSIGAATAGALAR